MAMVWAILITLCMLVATCGHKGPLRLPPDSAQHRGDVAELVTTAKINEVHHEL